MYDIPMEQRVLFKLCTSILKMASPDEQLREEKKTHVKVR